MILFASLLPVFINGQVNLVPNPGFEDTIHCSYDSTIVKAREWFTPTIGSPDYFYPTTQLNQPCNDQWPANWGGGGYANNAGYQVPYEGQAYVGCALTDGLEFFSIRLTDSLRTGRRYAVSFYVSLSNFSRSGIDLIQIELSDSSLAEYDTVSWLDYYLENVQPAMSNPSGNFILDTLNWVAIQDTIIGNGGELYLTVGNFDTAQAQYYLIDSLNPSTFAYYYFDNFDVHCIDCTSDTSEPPTYPEFSLTPSLTSGEITLSGNFPDGTQFEVFNALGQRVYYNEVPVGNHSQTIFLTLADGAYLYRIHSSGVTLKSGKLVLAH